MKTFGLLIAQFLSWRMLIAERTVQATLAVSIIRVQADSV
jgi:hypothetical protein